MRTARLVAAGVALLLVLGGQAFADIMNDGNGMAGWKGNVHFQLQMSIYLTDADVQYCVYDGAAAFLASFPGETLDPGQSDHYFYAYEVFNNLDPIADAVSYLSVGMDGNEQATDADFVDGDGVNPSDFVNNTFNRGWDLKDPRVAYPGYSDVLYFSSPFGPGDWATSHVTGIIPAGGELPSPTPEPNTVALLAVGAALVSVRRQGRGRTSRKNG